jgi:hypothetical protein
VNIQAPAHAIAARLAPFAIAQILMPSRKMPEGFMVDAQREDWENRTSRIASPARSALSAPRSKIAQVATVRDQDERPADPKAFSFLILFIAPLRSLESRIDGQNAGNSNPTLQLSTSKRLGRREMIALMQPCAWAALLHCVREASPTGACA